MAASHFTGSAFSECAAVVQKAFTRHCLSASPIHHPQPEFLVFPTRTPVYTWRVVSTATNRTISRHQILLCALRKAQWLNQKRGTQLLVRCQHETAETRWGQCDGGFLCPDLGTVHHRASERDLCYAHFLQAELD